MQTYELGRGILELASALSLDSALGSNHIKGEELKFSSSKNGVSKSRTFSHFDSFGSIFCALFSAFVFSEKNSNI